MALPKKRKRFDEDQTIKKNKRNASPASDPDTPSRDMHGQVKITGRREQMLKAFEMVDHMEHVHGMAVQEGSEYVSPAHDSSVDRTIPVGAEGSPLRSASDSLVDRHFEAHVRTGEADIPVIEMKIKVPRLFLKLPLLKDMTMLLLKKIGKE
jgi:sugar-specific transcriptional regulator TrmB